MDNLVFEYYKKCYEDELQDDIIASQDEGGEAAFKRAMKALHTNSERKKQMLKMMESRLGTISEPGYISTLVQDNTLEFYDGKKHVTKVSSIALLILIAFIALIILICNVSISLFTFFLLFIIFLLGCIVAFCLLGQAVIYLLLEYGRQKLDMANHDIESKLLQEIDDLKNAISVLEKSTKK